MENTNSKQVAQQHSDLIDIIRGALVDDVVQYHSPEWVARARAAVDGVVGQQVAALAQTYAHTKSGGVYRLLGAGLFESDLTPCTVYKCVNTGQVWVRPTSEFSTKFKAIAPVAAAVAMPAAAVMTLDQIMDEAAKHKRALVPLHINRAMQEVMEDEGWQWEDLLGAAEAITDEQYSEIQAAPAASVQPVDKGAQAEQANAWGAVVEALNEHYPNWPNLTNRGMDSAVEAIRLMAKKQPDSGRDAALWDANAEGYMTGLRVGLLEGASIIREVYVNHVFHTGVQGFEARCKEAEQVLIVKADAAHPAPSSDAALNSVIRRLMEKWEESRSGDTTIDRTLLADAVEALRKAKPLAAHPANVAQSVGDVDKVKHDVAGRLALWLSASMGQHSATDEMRKHIRAWLDHQPANVAQVGELSDAGIAASVLEFAAQVVELYDDATLSNANHMIDASEAAWIIRALPDYLAAAKKGGA